MHHKHLNGFLILIYSIVIPAFVAMSYWGNRAVTTISERIPPASGKCIVIDAGHGGEDGGTVSCTGIPESRYNLEIALRLDSLLQLLGYQTRMIRSEDTSVYISGNSIAQRKVSDLKERVRIVNEIHDALLVSIHQNYFSESIYSGAQVFYADSQSSRELAELLQKGLVETVNPGSNRKCKKADGIYIMNHVECTAVLVECGFLSNQQEEARLRDKTYQLKICSVIATTLAGSMENSVV